MAGFVVSPSFLVLQNSESSPRMTRYFCLLWSLGAFLYSPRICSSIVADDTGISETQFDQQGIRSDKPLEEFQNKLLDLAFDIATKIPIEPHIKDRSKAQEAVVTICLELDQPQRSAGYIEKIENWRQGACYADLAFYCSQWGYVDEAQQYLELALNASEDAEDWRRDRILSKIAKSHAWLGEYEKASELEAGVADSESGRVAQVRAARCSTETFESQIKTLDALVDSDNFDIVRNALRVHVELFDRFYENAGRRTVVEDRIKTAWAPIPIFLRIEILMDLADLALKHSDKSKALELVQEATDLMGKHEWPLEHYFGMTARMVQLRYLSGDEDKAKSLADAALAFYKDRREEIVDIWRAGALRPLAEAYQTMGDPENALSVYKLVVEEGMENPNSRPRAEDLSATCSSMAKLGLAPDEELWQRIRQIHEGLSAPW